MNITGKFVIKKIITTTDTVRGEVELEVVLRFSEELQ
jgi:hypothetical protein